MYSAYKLNKQGDSIQPWCTPFPIWNQSLVPCPVLGFSRGRSGGLVFPSLSEFPTVYCENELSACCCCCGCLAYHKKLISIPVVRYGCESWTIKKAENWRIDAFELWCLRRFLRVPGTARRSNQSILKETSPGCSLEGLMLKLKLQYFGHLIRRVDSFEKTLMLGKIEGSRRSGHQRMRWLDGINLMDMSLSKLW